MGIVGGKAMNYKSFLTIERRGEGYCVTLLNKNGKRLSTKTTFPVKEVAALNALRFAETTKLPLVI
ncbi:MAG: hypothetical protein LBP26_05275 [Clostridiales bacterium]|jgi:hypothetical protein|nr:hypothetical protein [Clostridiales bacterium]